MPAAATEDWRMSLVPRPGDRYSGDMSLTIVIDQDAMRIRYCRTPFEKEPDFKATSDNDDPDKLLAHPEELA